MNGGRKGIILAGGSGTRLWPLTIVSTKQLLPIYDKPMIYYPLTTLMLAGIRDILVITAEAEVPRFQSLLGDGSQWGVSLSYAVQAEPDGIAKAFIIGEQFIDGQACALILGDNVYYGAGLGEMVQRAAARGDDATVFCHWVNNPSRYGVLDFDAQNRPARIEEKPKQPKSNVAVTGLYFYDNDVLDIAAHVKPSARGEIEITDVNNAYLKRGDLYVEVLGRGFAWLDTGTHASLVEASHFVQILEQRQGLRIACPEEISLRQGYISLQQFEKVAEKSAKSSYGEYLKSVAQSFRR